MWEWREDTASGRWRLDSTGSWTWDEPSPLERLGDGRFEGFVRGPEHGERTVSWELDRWRPEPVAAPFALAEPRGVLPGRETRGWELDPRPGGSSWDLPRGWDAPAWDAPAWDAPAWPSWDGSALDGPGWAGGLATLPWTDVPIDGEPTPIFEAVADDRAGGGGAHAADAVRPGGDEDGAYPIIPEPHPGSGPFPVQRLEGLHDVDSPEDELRRRAERRRRPRSAESAASPPGPRGSDATGPGDAPVEARRPRGRHALGPARPVTEASEEDPVVGPGRHGRGL